MNTTTAAAEAHVTVATIRTWARRGVIAATKTAGKWVIDTTSLARRIAIGARRTARKAKAFVLTAEHCIALGGNRWQRGDMDRVYFNNWAEFAGLELTFYGTGNISSACWQGEGVSNSQGYKLIDSLHKVYFDVTDGKLYGRFGFGQSRVATQQEVLNAACRGIRAAAAAL
ncbi:hypothetical protein ACFWNR_06590 [Streptomyces virginiae]|uniref:hypothetical protein n=1 Tax=Streptomyces virginiae TaxID=1961 RepID=UPI003665BC27